MRAVGFFFLKILFIFRERGREREREEEKHQCVVASCVPPTGDLACNPGIELATLWFAGRCSIHRATPARARAGLYVVSQDDQVAIRVIPGSVAEGRR